MSIINLVINKKLKLFAFAALLAFSANFHVYGHGYHPEEEINVEKEQVFLEYQQTHSHD